MLRGVSVTTQLLSESVLRFGRQVLVDILQEPVRDLVRSHREGSAMEVDPSKLTTVKLAGSADRLAANQDSLQLFTRKLLDRVFAFTHWPGYSLIFNFNLIFFFSFSFLRV